MNLYIHYIVCMRSLWVLILSSMAALVTSDKPYLLRLKFSTRPGVKSFSNRLVDEFTTHFTAANPGVEVRDSFILPNNIPHLSYEEQEAGRVPEAKQSEEEMRHFKLASDLTSELTGASHIVIASPMFNWGAPSVLKAYIDRVVNTRTFQTPPVNLLAGIPVTFIIVSGGPYSADAPNSRPHMDFLRPYLRQVFTVLGSADEDLVFVNGDPTGPLDRGLVQESDAASGMSRARALLPAAAARIKRADSGKTEL